MKKIETLSEEGQLLLREIKERKAMSLTLRERLRNNDLIIDDLNSKLQQIEAKDVN
jgi:hypothetical protein